MTEDSSGLLIGTSDVFTMCFDTLRYKIELIFGHRDSVVDIGVFATIFDQLLHQFTSLDFPYSKVLIFVTAQHSHPLSDLSARLVFLVH